MARKRDGRYGEWDQPSSSLHLRQLTDSHCGTMIGRENIQTRRQKSLTRASQSSAPPPRSQELRQIRGAAHTIRRRLSLLDADASGIGASSTSRTSSSVSQRPCGRMEPAPERQRCEWRDADSMEQFLCVPQRRLAQIHLPNAYVVGHQDCTSATATQYMPLEAFNELGASRQCNIISGNESEDDYLEPGRAPFSAENLDRQWTTYKLHRPMIDRFLKLFQYSPKRNCYRLSGRCNSIIIDKERQPRATNDIAKETESTLSRSSNVYYNISASSHPPGRSAGGNLKESQKRNLLQCDSTRSHATLRPSKWNRCW